MKNRILACLITVLLAVISLFGCATEDTTTTKVVLNEVAHSIFYAPMYVAIEEGYFAEEGIDLELVTGFGVLVLVQIHSPAI